MNSEEALSRIKRSHRIAMACLEIDKPDIETEKAIKIIEKDLEVLEILKNVFNYKSIQQFIDSMSKEQWLKIKEWYNGSL